MRRVARHHLRQIAHAAQRGAIDAHRPERRRERRAAGRCEALDRHAVGRPEQHHAAHRAARSRELIVGPRRDRA
jgi:hypothetical protein